MTLGLLRKQPANFSVISHTYGLLGLTYIKINQLHLALININKCLTLRREYLGEKHLTTAEAFWLLGRFYECRLNADSALRYYQLALISGSDEFNNINVAVNPSFSQSKNNDNLIEYLACKASVLKKKFISNPKDTFSIALSLKCYELLDSLVAFSRKAMDTEKSRLSFSVSSHELYEEAIESAYLMYQLTNQKQYIQHAFHFFEKNKYLILLEKLNMAEAVNKAGIPDSIAEMEQNLNSELKFVQDQLADELNKKNADSVKIQSLNTKVFKTIRQIEYLHGILEKEYPNYFRIKYPDTTIHLENLQAYSLKEKMNIVQYFWGEKSIYMISVSGNRVNFIRLSNDRELRDCLTHFISLLHEANVTSAEKFKEYSDISYYLYERIIKPTLIMAKPNGIGVRKITIIPDGLFAKLSFETLTTSVSNSAKIDYKTCHYLVYQYNIQYAYSSNILIGHSNANRTRYINQLLGFGYSGPNPSIDRSAKNSLPGTSDEMKVISKYFRTKLFLGADATEYNFKKDVAGYDIIHLALHGTADEEQETDTKLIFRNDKGSKEDGLLYSNEVYNLHLHAKLVVLSACETGIGKNYKGEGVFSLARAFSYAGCSSVVISLWKVNDQATSDLMGNFYENLSKGAAIGQSLYKAKLEYLNNADEYSAHPAFWASFVAFGDMSPLKSRHSFMPWLIVLLVIICGTGFVYKSKLINILFKRLSKKLKLNAKSESRKE